MPDLSPTQGPGDTGPLPSFYSPQTAARQTAENDEDVNPAAGLALSTEDPAPLGLGVDDEPDHVAPSASTPSTPVQAPPSLLSPALTPPSTPGAATPSTGVARLLSEPRGIPVDSSIPTGGCGSKHPQLLETLPHVECVVRARIPTTTGAEMFLHLYTNDVDKKEHLAIVFGRTIRSKSLDAVREGETELDRLVRGAYTGRLYPGRIASNLGASAPASNAAIAGMDTEEKKEKTPPLVRIHSECYTGETVWSARCDCGEQLDEAARLMSLPSNDAGGIIIYLRQEGRGIGLGEKLKAYNLQDLGSDTVEANLLLRHPADARSYGLATSMLLDLGQKEVRLLTNNPDKIRAVEGPNREVVVTERVAMVPLSWKGQGGFRAPEVENYLKTKVILFHPFPPPLEACYVE
ncbi:GTP cyclohydrolase II-domain-containing protein [Lasiosphaeria miniovina]|uniref:GTP cyclohydrolase II n=1 Tax=Lasiosphaeria miniovina TaxID=1954250 RepID=A0AA40AK83_9PEZI|nr:GTP cyclohydrolase II-domain-containing protein [Lasiosphaeria miniovina]KAK0717392.1 GTP cyclohydrolase II-domain-containing protein [Lasiosphaeria miniovina]